MWLDEALFPVSPEFYVTRHGEFTNRDDCLAACSLDNHCNGATYRGSNQECYLLSIAEDMTTTQSYAVMNIYQAYRLCQPGVHTASRHTDEDRPPSILDTVACSASLAPATDCFRIRKRVAGECAHRCRIGPLVVSRSMHSCGCFVVF